MVVKKIPRIVSRFYQKMAAVIPAVTRVSPRIIRVLGCNPGFMTLQGTNTYIVGTGKRRILIDAGDADVPHYINHLRNVLRHEDIDLAHIFLTHWHHDHVGGLKDILEQLPEFTENCEIWKYPRHEDHQIHADLGSLKDGQEFSVEGATLRVLHTPGHASDHVVFCLLEENALFSGDCVLGEGTAIFEDLFDYLNSLKVILDNQPSVIYPGHGNTIQDPIQRIQFYISHRLQREEQILDVLTKNQQQTFTEYELVTAIYKGLNEKLIKAAECNVNHHLQKLLKEDKVININNRWQIGNFKVF